MNRHQQMCPHCRAKAAGADTVDTVEAQELELPAEPTPIRVHNGDMPPFDCTLHPDGTLTAVLGGEQRRNALTFAEMRERNWATAHFEIKPGPLPELVEAAVVVQDAIPLPTP
ncbi:hypothetical protein [Streptomyces aureus]|uniref:hypothetical protein n=1 Tax=Streptomyces aureus TaxID=193461 RepID=UPI000562AA71|nr:hypothetical protein [Streptomyces aureus]